MGSFPDTLIASESLRRVLAELNFAGELLLMLDKGKYNVRNKKKILLLINSVIIIIIIIIIVILIIIMCF